MYTIGQKVCLWQMDFRDNPTVSLVLEILKEVIVTITEVKTGVPGEFSGQAVSSQSLRGIGDDGKSYEKHWESWPESQTDDFHSSWSLREDGVGERFWIPREAISVYNDISRHQKRSGNRIAILEFPSGPSMKPKGDIVYCATHDRYWHKGVECLFCRTKKVE